MVKISLVYFFCCTLFKMGFILFAFVATIFVWCFNRLKMRVYVNLAYKIPSSKWQRFFGWGKIFNSKEMITGMSEYTTKYGPNCVIWFGGIPAFLTTDPQTIKEILTSENCINKPELFYNGISSVAGQGLISENGPLWSLHRRLMNKAFSNKNLLSWLTIFNKGINNVIKEIQTSIDKGDAVDILTMFRILTIKNASQTVLKTNIDLTKYDAAKMTQIFQEVLEYITTVTKSVTMKISVVHKLADVFLFKSARKSFKLFQSFIEESVQAVENNNTTDPSYMTEVNSVLDFAVSGSKQDLIKRSEIQQEVTHLFSAAFETTASTLYMALVLLAMHPEYQDRVYEEVNNIVPEDDTEMTIEQLEHLVYLEMVLNETMRLFPSVPIVFRKVSNEDFTLSNGLTLAIDQTICIDIYHLHRSQDIWGPDANAFNPENFLPSNKAMRHSFSYIPFTRGKRICIGWRFTALFAKISLSKLIKYYKFSTDFKYEDIILEENITIKFAKNPPLYIERREQS